MTTSNCLVLATRNPGKTVEIKTLLAEYPVIIKNLDDFGPIPEIEEDGTSFEENAYKKASLTARFLGHAALADDSGLVVRALDGRPGIHSARYGGEGLTDEDRCRRLLTEMTGQIDRQAAFHCVISLAVPTGPALTYEAQCPGLITETMTGSGGFGYDPVFYSPALKKTFAEMNTTQKNRISHRGLALQELGNEFENVLKWLEIHMPELERFDCRKTT